MNRVEVQLQWFVYFFQKLDIEQVHSFVSALPHNRSDLYVLNGELAFFNCALCHFVWGSIWKNSGLINCDDMAQKILKISAQLSYCSSVNYFSTIYLHSPRVKIFFLWNIYVFISFALWPWPLFRLLHWLPWHLVTDNTSSSLWKTFYLFVNWCFLHNIIPMTLFNIFITSLPFSVSLMKNLMSVHCS